MKSLDACWRVKCHDTLACCTSIADVNKIVILFNRLQLSTSILPNECRINCALCRDTSGLELSEDRFCIDAFGACIE